MGGLAEALKSTTVGDLMREINDPLAWSPYNTGTRLYARSEKGSVVKKKICFICGRRQEDCFNTGEGKIG